MKDILWAATIVTPLVAYFCAYVYERGYASFFGIPLQFISLDIARIIYSLIIVLATVLFFVFIIGELIYTLFSDHISRLYQKPVGRSIITMMVVFIFVLINFFGAGFALSTYIVLGVWVFIVFLEFIFPLFEKISDSTYAEKFEQHKKIEASIPRISSLFGKHIGFVALLRLSSVFVLFMFLFSLAYNLGIREARKAREFLVVSGEVERVVLRIYGNNVILAPFDRSSRVVYPEFNILNIQEPDLILKEEKIGPLVTVEPMVKD